MASPIWLPSTRIAQPQNAVGVNRSNPFTRSILAAYPDGATNFAGGAFPNATLSSSSVVKSPSSMGMALSFSNNAYSSYGAASAFIPPSPESSVRWWTFFTAYPASYGCMLTAEAGIYYAKSYIKANGKLALYTAGVISGTYYDGGVNTLALNAWNCIDVVFDSANSSITQYVNGQYDGKPSVYCGDIGTTSGLITFGYDPDNPTSYPFVGSMLDLTFWNRVRSASEIASSYSASPWSIFEDEQTYFPFAASSIPTLSAALMSGITSTGGYPRVTRA